MKLNLVEIGKYIGSIDRKKGDVVRLLTSDVLKNIKDKDLLPQGQQIVFKLNDKKQLVPDDGFVLWKEQEGMIIQFVGWGIICTYISGDVNASSVVLQLTESQVKNLKFDLLRELRNRDITPGMWNKYNDLKNDPVVQRKKIGFRFGGEQLGAQGNPEGNGGVKGVGFCIGGKGNE